MEEVTECSKEFSKFNLNFKYVDLTKADNLNNHLTKKTKLIWVETPSNPLMNIIDIVEIKKNNK